MQVRLTEELFRSGKYDLTVTDKSLVFRKSEGTQIEIPFSEMKQFSLEGKGKLLKRFVLETASGSYEGMFLNRGDSEQVIAQLRDRCGCYVDVRLNME